MSDLWSFLFSPAGLVLYAVFWAFKLLFGALIVSQLMQLLPDAYQSSLRRLMNRWKPSTPFALALVPIGKQRRANKQNLPPVMSRHSHQ